MLPAIQTPLYMTDCFYRTSLNTEQMKNAKFEIFTAKIQVQVLWVVTPCSIVVGYQRFGGYCCFRLHPQHSMVS